MDQGNPDARTGLAEDAFRPLPEVCQGAMPVAAFLQFAENASAALAHWQRERIAHGGLTPYTLLVCKRRWEVRLAAPAPAPAGLALPYLAPEQSGRINRRLDPRSDCYALGIVFYQLLTGHLPFQAGDPLEWIHAHVARVPLPPHRARAGIPVVLSDIIMKMLEKPPELRYQGIASLQADLNRCARQWQARGSIERFLIGSFDVAARLSAPQRLLGREAELASMLGCFNRVVTDGGPALLLVSGYAGVGKSALVAEMEKAVLTRGGIFIAGKFDQYKRHTPYATLGEALRQLVQTLLTGEARSTAGWGARLRASLQGNAALLFDLIAPLRTLIGDLPPVPELPPKEALHRFYHTLRALIGALASAAHPLTIVLDDLHWADPGSLAFLDYLLVEAPAPNVLVVGTFRDNEVRPAHPLAQAIRHLGRAELPVTSVVLGPLPGTLTARLTADVLGMPLRRVQPLAALVQRKTAGNPLFALQFLRRLEQEGLLRLDTVKLSWTWDLARIGQQGYTDNVVDLIVDSIKHLLSGPTLEALRCAACIGQAGSLALLARLNGDGARAALREAVGAGIVELTGEDGYRFSHDRFQQAAYSMVPMVERTALHLRIARLLREDCGDESLFEMADHFNLGAVHARSDDECRILVDANLRAGRKAKAAGAYASATHYLASASRHLGPGGYQTDYATAFSVHIELATCEFMIARAAQAGQLANTLLRQARSDEERMRVLRLKIEIAGATGRYADAIASLAQCGQLLGTHIDTAPSHGDVERAMQSVCALLRERPPDSLDALAPMTDPNCRSLLDALRSALRPAFLTSADLYATVVLAMVSLSLHHGNGPASAVGYIGFAKLCCQRGWIELAGRFETLALNLAEQDWAAPYRAEVHFVAGGFVSPDTRPMRAGLASLQLAFEDARGRGDQPYAAYCCYGIIERRSSLGDALPDLLQDAAVRLDYVQRTALKDVHTRLLVWRQFLRCLRGETRQPPSFDGDGFSEQAIEMALRAKPDNPTHLVYHGLRLQARYLLGDYRGAVEDAEQARAFLHASNGMQEAELVMFHALAAAALYRDSATAAARRPALRQTVAEACAHLQQRAGHAPGNFSARHLLVSAELARIDGHVAPAMDAYARAIDSADRDGYVHLCALTHELAAGFYREQGLRRQADSCLKEALGDYRRWGAGAKVAELQRRFPDLLRAHEPALAGTNLSPDVDLLAVAKAAQSMSGEVAAARLHETLLRIVLEHAGAQSGHLLLMRSGQLHIEAVGEFKTEGYRARSLQSVPLASGSVPRSVIEHVARTRQPLVIDDARTDARFAQDSYLDRKRCCAVLCLPIQRHQTLTGILYAENRILPDAFRAINLDVLELLISQAAISLENASLYEHLQESQARLSAVMDNVPAGVYVKDLDGRYLFINRETETSLGIALADILGKTDRELFAADPACAARLRDADLLVIQQGRSRTYEESVRMPTGEVRTFLTVKAPLVRDGKVQGLCGISTDVSEQREARERVEYLARYDALTGLPNRTLLIDYLDIAIANARRAGQSVALLFLDLDRFKAINDSLGHWAGDLVLKEVATRLRACVREADTVARLAGDEFIVVVSNLDNPDNARQSARKVIDALSHPMHMQGHQVSIGVSIGISLFPQDAPDPETLLKHADMAMYHAKPVGREKYQFFDTAMNQRAQERLMLENQLRTALANHELYLEYQPQVDLHDRRIVGAEALLRWQHPQFGMVPPSKFIPIAEDCGLIGEITCWVIDQACAQLRSWQRQGLPRLSLAINISALCLMHNTLCDNLAAALLIHGLDGELLELEMTEGILMRDVEASISKLRELKGLGVGLAIDDFGTGYSSLSYLKQLPVDKLKIDQSFVRDIAHDPNDSAITSTIIAMAKHLHLKVIAEGVEDAAAERFLCEHHCDQMQGFLFSRPVSAEALALMVHVTACASSIGG